MLSNYKFIKALLWNVEGLKSLMNLGVGDYFEQFEVLMFTETFQRVPTRLRSHCVFETSAIVNSDDWIIRMGKVVQRKTGK